MKKLGRICSILIMVAACTLIAQGGAIVAYSDPTGVGNQSFGGTLGWDFNVNSPSGIKVYSVGAFDSGQDGFQNPITLSIYDLSNTASPLFTKSISGGTLVGGDRFYSLAVPLFLTPGTYSIVAQGFSQSDPNGNTLFNPLGSFSSPSVNDGGGLISFTGTSRWGMSGFPTNLQSGEIFGAGTFTFDNAASLSGQATDTAPEPASVALMGGGLLLVGLWSRRCSR